MPAKEPWPRPGRSRLRLAYLPWSGGPGQLPGSNTACSAQVSSSAGPAVNQVKKQRQFLGSINLDKSLPNLPEHPSRSFDVRQLHHLLHDVSETAFKDLFSDHNSMTCSSSYCVQEQSIFSPADQLAAGCADRYRISMIDEILQNAEP